MGALSRAALRLFPSSEDAFLFCGVPTLSICKPIAASSLSALEVSPAICWIAWWTVVADGLPVAPFLLTTESTARASDMFSCKAAFIHASIGLLLPLATVKLLISTGWLDQGPGSVLQHSRAHARTGHRLLAATCSDSCNGGCLRPGCCYLARPGAWECSAALESAHSNWTQAASSNLQRFLQWPAFTSLVLLPSLVRHVRDWSACAEPMLLAYEVWLVALAAGGDLAAALVQGGGGSANLCQICPISGSWRG
jgi:hypothetical protein